MERVKEYYDCLLGKSKGVSNWVDYIEECYQNETTDEFIQAAKNENYKGMQEDDGLIFVNFRNDRNETTH